jgi:hypothetical protein
MRRMWWRRRPRPIPVAVIYVVVGVVVAAIYDYFDKLDTGRQIGTAVLAVLVWPLLLFGLDVELK